MGRLRGAAWPRPAAQGPTPAPPRRLQVWPGSPPGTSPGARLAGEGPGVTEAPIFSWACGPPGGRRITASSAGGQRERVSGGVPGPELGHAYAMLEFQFSLPLRILREPVLALFPVPPPTAGCVSLGHGREGGGSWGWERCVWGEFGKISGPPSRRGKLSLLSLRGVSSLVIPPPPSVSNNENFGFGELGRKPNRQPRKVIR